MRTISTEIKEFIKQKIKEGYRNWEIIKMDIVAENRISITTIEKIRKEFYANISEEERKGIEKRKEKRLWLDKKSYLLELLAQNKDLYEIARILADKKNSKLKKEIELLAKELSQLIEAEIIEKTPEIESFIRKHLITEKGEER